MRYKTLIALVFLATSIPYAGISQLQLSEQQMLEAMPYSFGPGFRTVREPVKTFLDSINPKAVDHFSRHFDAPDSATWMKVSDGYLAKFRSGNIETRVYYSQSGKFLGTLKGYLADILPKDVFMNVYSKYPDFDVVYVEEAVVVQLPGVKTYFVQMQRGTEIKVLRICEDEITVIKGSTER